MAPSALCFCIYYPACPFWGLGAVAGSQQLEEGEGLGGYYELVISSLPAEGSGIPMSSTDEITLFKGTFSLPSVKTSVSGAGGASEKPGGSSSVGGSVDGWVALLGAF